MVMHESPPRGMAQSPGEDKRRLSWATDQSADSDREPFLSKIQAPSSPGRKRLALTLVITNIFWIGIVLLAVLGRFTSGRVQYATDFKSISTTVKLTRFDDMLRYNSSIHKFWRDLDNSQPQYFGKPSHAIDSAWSELLHGQTIAVSDFEISSNNLQFNEEDRHPQTGQFQVALGVYHSLHCLNAVRKELDKDYYDAPHPVIWTEESQWRVHIDHCLNKIRQSLQCRPDLTPLPMKKEVDMFDHSFLLGNAEEHSCYDWAGIQEWTDKSR